MNYGAMIFFVFLLTSSAAFGQEEACIRITRQDSTLNNLVDPPGYPTAVLGSLGKVIETGTGTQPMILIPGLGFSGSVFNDLMQELSGEYRMYAVTLPGFGGTAAPPLPDPKESFGKQAWTNAALSAIEKLMDEKNMKNPIIVGHWLTGTQLALRLAMKHPERIKAVVLLSGSAKMMVDDSVYALYYGTLEKRIAGMDRWMSPRWFKTVTRETWDDNNFLPGDYAVNPVRGLRLWREAASPRLHVWIRYLTEFNAQDISFEMDKVTVPTLLLKPGLEGLVGSPDQSHMFDYCHKSWVGSIEKNVSIKVKTIPNARVCLWFDQPQRVKREVIDFLGSVK